MKHQLKSLAANNEFNDLFNDYCKSIELSLLLMDHEGNILIQSGVKESHDDECRERLNHMIINSGVWDSFKLCLCSDGLNYAVFPINIDGELIGYLITGPLFIHSTEIVVPSYLSLTLKMLCYIIQEKIKRKRAQAAKDAAERQLEGYNLLDPITYLPSRMNFLQRLDKEIDNCKESGSRLALFMIDLDNFKSINNSFGHEYGNIILKQAAEKIRRIIEDKGVACRFGGDQFAAFVSDIKNKSEIFFIAESIISFFKNIIRVNDYEILSPASLGIAIYPDHGKNYKVLLNNADTAMYKAKKNGKNQYQLYESTMVNDIKEKIIIEIELKKAIEEKQFILYYQPLIDAKSGKITKVEVLIRWLHPKFGLIPPSDFIYIAEENGLITPIGEWVLRTACQQCKAWHDKGYDLPISVNISAVQLQSEHFTKNIFDILNDTGLKPKYLELEITESEVIKKIDENIVKLDELRKIGVRMALDDFGTGYSSLSYLYMLPISGLKIDKSFIDKICSDKRIESIIDGLIMLSRELDIEVTAEGVERAGQFKLLARKGCNQIQGYYISRPLEPKQLEEFYLRYREVGVISIA